MIIMNDIYNKIDSKIVASNFWQLDIEDKKILIEKELKEYIILKILELDSNAILINENEENKDIVELFNILANLIPKEIHDKTLCHFIHYIINVAGSLQNWSVVWYEEIDEALVDCPTIELKGELWDSLKTHKETDYVKTFLFIFDTFKNNFMNENTKQQKLTKKVQ